MTGFSALLANRVASLVPKTTAGACVPHTCRYGNLVKCPHDYCCTYRVECCLSCDGRVSVCSSTGVLEAGTCHQLT